mgnify:CR=1 FL=1
MVKKARLRRNLLYIIKMNPGINTRDLFTFVSAPRITKQMICGHLSWMKRTGFIRIKTIQPGRFSIAF